MSVIFTIFVDVKYEEIRMILSFLLIGFSPPVFLNYFNVI
jgi:hypothetical protein